MCLKWCMRKFNLPNFKLQMNETYQHPGKWHENHINPTLIRFDNTHFIMSHVIKNLEHNAVYEAIVQAKNKYGWNEVIYVCM